VADATAALPARRRVALQTLERSGAARIETVAGLLSSPRRAQR